MRLASALQAIASAAGTAASKLESIDLNQVPENVQIRLNKLWEERTSLVEGIQELVAGLNGMQQLVTQLSQRMDNAEARLDTVEMNQAVLRGREDVPPPPPRLDGDDEVWLGAATLDENA